MRRVLTVYQLMTILEENHHSFLIVENDPQLYEDAGEMVKYLAQALKQTSREATILLYTSALELACLDCYRFAVPLYPDSAHSSKDKYLLPVIQSSLIFARG